MIGDLPLVSIGIPTYNRAVLLERAIKSGLSQDYENIEIIVSDNGSTDKTEAICQFYCNTYSRFRYIRHSKNRGPVENFFDVLETASGDFFMWLGDDDWIDPCYVSACAQQLINDNTIVLVSGSPQYYRNGESLYGGKVFNLLYTLWWQRVIAYYVNVADNGMFYGLMRTTQIQQVAIPSFIGGDWIMVAELVSMGKAKMLPEISVHREMGGATVSYQQIAISVGFSRMQAIFPMLTVASSAWLAIMAKDGAYRSRSVLSRFIVAGIVFIVIHLSQMFKYARAAIRLFKSHIKRLFEGA